MAYTLCQKVRDLTPYRPVSGDFPIRLDEMCIRDRLRTASIITLHHLTSFKIQNRISVLGQKQSADNQVERLICDQFRGCEIGTVSYTHQMCIRDRLNAVSASLERLKNEMRTLAAQLPEYPVVMAMRGVGNSLGPQLMAELGDVTRFTHRNAITAFAGVDPGADQSGTHEAKSTRASKSGPPELRKALFLLMDCLLKTMPSDDPVYRFMDKKRSEGKPYLVYMTAGANKFLRIYYGRVKEYLASLEEN